MASGYRIFSAHNFDLVACGFALDRSTEENGCLVVLPGSHKGPVLDHRNEKREFVGAITEPMDAARLEQAHRIELEPGDMSIHHASIIHGSLENHSADSRRLFICQYAASDAIPLDRRPLQNEYSERVLRGNPPTHARLAGAMRVPLRGEVGEAKSLFDRQQKGG